MITIRPARPDDEPGVVRLAAELADFPVPPWRTPGEIARADLPILQAALRQTPDDQLFLVAESEEGMAGCIYVVTQRDYFTGEALAYIEVLAVAPEARGMGVARKLMDAAESWATGRGYRRIRLAVWSQNERARGLYEHLGYQAETMYYLKELDARPHHRQP
jgi:ribosomal protein S18 acetylase RimI-like enzyme